MSFWTDLVESQDQALYINDSTHTAIFHIKQPTQYGPEVIVKRITCTSDTATQKAENEAQLVREHPHPNILNCLGWTKEVKPQGWSYVYIFSTPMPMSLSADITRRCKEQTYYREEELWDFYEQLLGAFVHLQELKIAHRDIKPQNILLTPGGNQLKICDFGFARRINPAGPDVVSLLFTYQYCAPVLRRSYLDKNYQMQHNVFKSDVFSLGMTMLNLTLLMIPEKLAELPNLQRNIDTELAKIQRYSERWVNQLRIMLCEDEARRPDFLQLRAPLPFADDEEVQPLHCESDCDTPLAVSVKCGLQHIRVNEHRVDEVPCMVTLKAKEQEPDERTYGLDLLCVIDRSGSMQGDLIRQVKACLKGLLTRLGEQDRVSLVCFSREAERQCPLIRCSDAGKDRLRTIVEGISCHGTTNIASGFLMGLDVLKRRRTINQAASLLLFSDGRNNEGGNPRGPCMQALQECRLGKFTVCTFGYGTDLDSQLLEELAITSKGQFQHITKQTEILQVFAFTLSNFTSVVARNVLVSVEVLPNCRVPCDITTVYSKDSSQVFSLPDIHANEQKELIFLLQPRHQSLAKNLSSPVVHVSVTYIANDDTDTTADASMTAKFVNWEGNAKSGEDSSVYRHWYRVRGADYLRRARELAAGGKFRDADEELKNGIEVLTASGYLGLPLVQEVLHDLKAARELVQSNTTWERGGDAHFASISYSHFSQSATALTKHYATRLQKAQMEEILERSDSASSLQDS